MEKIYLLIPFYLFLVACHSDEDPIADGGLNDATLFDVSMCHVDIAEKFTSTVRPCSRRTYDCMRSCEEPSTLDTVACQQECIGRDPQGICRQCWRTNISYCMAKACNIDFYSLRCCVSNNCRSEFMTECIDTNCYVEADRLKSCRFRCDNEVLECFENRL